MVELFEVQVFSSGGLDILATLDCYTILKPKIHLMHTFNHNLRLKAIYLIFIFQNIETFESVNRKLSDKNRKIVTALKSV